MNKKVYQWILKIGVFLSFISIFLLFNKLFFPYVASKQLSFNILIEVLTVFWLVYIIKYKEERPKLGILSWSLIAFFGAILISTLVSIDPHLSFWGKTERMLGFVHAVHFLAFYFIIITAFKRLVDFKYLVSALVLSALAIAISMLASGNIKAVIGNQAYTVGFFLFGIYLSIYLFFKTKTNWRYLFLVPVIIILVAFLMANITGAVIGLGASILLALILVALLYKRLWYRLGAGVLALLIILTVVVALVYPNQSWIKNNRVLSEISLETNTLQTRFIAWKAALINYQEYPVLGTGYNTFSYTFDKHFKADFYNHSMTETYFDRAHNNLLDIASSMGSIGLGAYLMIMISALIYFIKIFKFSRKAETEAWREKKELEVEEAESLSTKALKMSKKKQKKLEKKLRKKGKGISSDSSNLNNRKRAESSVLSSYLNFSSSNHLLALIALFSLLVAYFVQNLAVFDTYITYLALMIFLAFIRFLYMEIKASYSKNGNREKGGNKKEGEDIEEEKEEKKKEKKMPVALEYILLIVLAIACALLMYKLNISTFKAHSQAIAGYSQIYRGEVNKGLDTFVSALDSQTPLQRDPRSSLIKLILANPQLLNNLSTEEKIEYYNRLLVLNSYNLKNSSNYSVYLLQEAQLFNDMSELYKKLEDEDKTVLYKEKALEYINSAIKASPERIKQYWIKGQILIDLGKQEAGLEQWGKAIRLNENYGETYCQYAQAYLITSQEEEAWKQMDKCINSGGLNSYAQRAVLGQAVKYYQGKGDYDNLLAVYHRYAELADSAKVWQSLAEMYTEKERWQEAQTSAEKALELVEDDKLKNSIKVFLDIVERKLSE
jgi:O-antigen ligase/tetratricopeptide (TPR) repeat protein